MNAIHNRGTEAPRAVDVAENFGTLRDMHGQNLYAHWCGGDRVNRRRWSDIGKVERERWCKLAEELQSLGVG